MFCNKSKRIFRRLWLGVSTVILGLGLWGIAAGAFATAAGAVPLQPRESRPKISVANASKVQELTQLDKDVRGIVWASDGKQAAFVYWEAPVEIVDAESFRFLRRIGDDKRLIHFAFSSDRDRVAFCENGNQAEILDLRSKQSIPIDADNNQPDMKFSPDGRLLATGGYGNTAKVWCGHCGHLLRSLDMGDVTGGLTPVFSPDGKILAVGNRNSTTRLFDPSSGELLQVLDRKMTQEIRFRPDSKVLAATYVDGSIGLWNVADGKLLHLAPSGAEELYTLDWSPGGDILATAGHHGRITLWNPKDLSVLKELDGPEWVICVRFSPDGTRLLTAGGGDFPATERKVRVWGVPQPGKQDTAGKPRNQKK